ncbi:MAG: hypothetical protein AAFU65_11685, partial [Pseudomonadota bacterium]
MWRALDAVPQPAIRLVAPFVHERQVPIHRITQPVRPSLSTVEQFSGHVMGPGDLPLKNARVDVPGTSIVTYTDRAGHFEFRAIRDFPARRGLRVSARGETQTLEGPFSDDEPVVIRMKFEEN